LGLRGREKEEEVNENYMTRELHDLNWPSSNTGMIKLMNMR
jgi:hypothetical protein